MPVGTVLQPNMAAEKKPDILVHRNEMVRLRIEGPGFRITGMGQAIDEGRPGDTIKVRNVDSKQVITGLIAFDGSVEPCSGDNRKPVAGSLFGRSPAGEVRKA